MEQGTRADHIRDELEELESEIAHYENGRRYVNNKLGPLYERRKQLRAQARSRSSVYAFYRKPQINEEANLLWHWFETAYEYGVTLDKEYDWFLLVGHKRNIPTSSAVFYFESLNITQSVRKILSLYDHKDSVTVRNNRVICTDAAVSLHISQSFGLPTRLVWTAIKENGRPRTYARTSVKGLKIGRYLRTINE